ncbi:MAG: single-stranded DNA-binding protein [Acidimicrobiales bacterium]
MAPGNTVTIVGNATREPELRFTASGQAVATFGVAVNRRWQNRNNEWEESTSFFDVTCWAQLAENVAESVPKGGRVVVTGRLDQRSWETQEGDKRSKVEIVADDVAPSLRWATAQITKNERRDGGDGGGYAGGGGGGGSSRPAAPSEPATGGGGGYDPDEEPF